MTISSTTRKAGPFSGTGAQTAFPFSFKVFTASDLLVVQTDASGVENELTLNTHYSVALNANQDANPGGTVNLTIALPTGNVLAIGSAIPLTQTSSIPNMGGFYPKVIEQALDKLTIGSQQTAELVMRCLRFPFSDGSPQGDLPAAAARAGKFFAFDGAGNPTAASGTGADAGLRTDLASPVAGSALIIFIQAGVDAVARAVQDELRDVIKITQFGGSVAASTAANKAALQKAIAAVDANGGGTVIVPGGLNYGYVRTNPATHPDFTSCTTAITVIDYGVGDSYTAPAQDGAQIRKFLFTPDPSNTDANVIYHRGAWHPAHLISNDANLAAPNDPSRTDLDNRRASIFFENDGSSTWRVGQGDRVGKALTNEELSNFVVESYATTGDTLGNYAPLIIERKTGNWAFGQGNTTPQASYYFKSVTAGFSTMVIESLDATTHLTLRNSNGSGQDVDFLNRNGDFVFNVPALGDAVYIKGSTRYMGVGGAGNYQLDVSESRSGNFVTKISNTSATNGDVMYLASSSSPGTGWDGLLIEASGANAIFRLRGDGNGLCDGSWTGGGADRAEMFEWVDGNPDGTDGEKKEVGSNRAGYSVSLVDGKIRISQAGDVPIGVVSLTYDSLGNAAPLNWTGKFLNDDLGQPVVEACEIVSWEERILREPAKEAIPASVRTYIRDGKPCSFTDPGMPAREARYEVKKHSHYSDEIPAGVAIPADARYAAAKRRKLNPAFDKSETYIPRTARKEWDAVGIIGVCRVRKGQVTAPTWIKMRDISDQVEEWMIR